MYSSENACYLKIKQRGPLVNPQYTMKVRILSYTDENKIRKSEDICEYNVQAKKTQNLRTNVRLILISSIRSGNSNIH